MLMSRGSYMTAHQNLPLSVTGCVQLVELADIIRALLAKE